MKSNIVLRFSTRKGILATIIRYITWGMYSHVDIETPDGKLLGARVMGGVKIREDDGEAVFQRYEINLTAKQARLFWKFAYSQVGKPYDMIAILCYPFRIPHHRKGAWDCSEYAGQCFEEAEVPLQRVDATYKLSPRDLRMSPLLSEYGHRVNKQGEANA